MGLRNFVEVKFFTVAFFFGSFCICIQTEPILQVFGIWRPYAKKCQFFNSMPGFRQERKPLKKFDCVLNLNALKTSESNE